MPGCRRLARVARGGRGNRGGGGGLPGLSAPGGRVAVVPGRSISLPAEPAGLTKLAAGSDEIARPGEECVGEAGLAGRPAPVVTAAPLTAEQQKRFDAGAEIYKNICMGCHQEDGRGKEKLGANLVDSPYATAADSSGMIRILVGGKEGPIGLMPPLGAALTDEQIAARHHLRSALVGPHRIGHRPVERDGSARPVEGQGQAVDR